MFLTQYSHLLNWSMIKQITFLVFFCAFNIILLNGSYADDGPGKDTSAFSKKDTAKTRSYRVINRNFNDIYIQNLMPAYFGQEFFDPHKTLLVSDLVGNFVVFATPASRFFLVASPRVNLRLFDGQGSPVKSPSYMPAGTVYFRINSDYYHPHFI